MRLSRPAAAAVRHTLRQPLFITAVVFSFGLWGFAELADEVSDGGTQSFDRSILLAFRDADDPHRTIGPESFAEILRDVTALGSLTVLTLLTAVICGFLWLSRRPDLALSALAAAVGGCVLTFALKAFYARPRPDLVPHLLTDVSSASFPSGHAMASAVVYLTLGAIVTEFVHRRPIKAYVMTVAVALTIAIGLTRVALGVHYPTDVLAGWAAGILWAYGCRSLVRLLRFWRHRKGLAAASPPTPGEPPAPKADGLQHQPPEQSRRG